MKNAIFISMVTVFLIFLVTGFSSAGVKQDLAALEAAVEDLRQKIDEQQAQIEQIFGGFVTYAGSAFAASIQQGGEGWSPNYTGYGFLTPAEIREGPDQVALIALSKDVQLPDSAVVTGFSCYWYDNDEAGDVNYFDAIIIRRGLLNINPNIMARMYITPEPTNETVIHSEFTDTVAYPVIDNESFSYHINVSFSLGRTTPNRPDDIRWYGCQVTYEM